MASSKRKYAGIERELIRTLTTACEIAKSEIVGFQWLTHEVDYAHFPQSLMVIWVFADEASKARASSGAQKARVLELTQAAVEETGISVANIAAHVRFDSEQRQAGRSRGQGH